MTQYNYTITDPQEYTSGIECGKDLAYVMLADGARGLAAMLSDVKDLVNNPIDATGAPIPVDWKLGYLVGVIAELAEQAQAR